MKKLYGGMMMPLERPRSQSRQRPRARESPAAPEAEIDNVLDGPGDYVFDDNTLSAQENSELNARGPGGGPAFTEAEKFFYKEATKLFTKNNLKLLRDLLPGPWKMKLPALRGKYDFIKNNSDVTYYISQLSCGCNRSKPKSGLLKELSKVQSGSGIPGDIADMIELRKKTNDLAKRGIFKTYNLSRHLNAASENAFDFIELLDHVSKYYGDVKCSDTTYLNKKNWYKNSNELDSIEKTPTGVSGPIETAVTRSSPMSSPMRNTKHRESRPINKRSTRTRRHPSKPVNPKCDNERLKYYINSWENTTTHEGKKKIIGDMVNYFEAIKKGRVKCNDGGVLISSLETHIEEYMREIRPQRAKKNKKGKTNKRGKNNKRGKTKRGKKKK